MIKINIDSLYNKLLISKGYLFGLCSSGYISVFDLKPKNK